MLSLNSSAMYQLDVGQELRIMAAAIADIIETTAYTFRPKRKQAHPPRTTWASRLEGYRWRGSNSSITDWQTVGALEAVLGTACRKIIKGSEWSATEQAEVQRAVYDLFKWGGVLRGKGHNPPCIESTRRVMQTAYHSHDVYSAPLDSGWTKLAATSTAWVGEDQRVPQVIYDSRVSVALLDAIETACRYDPGLIGTRDKIRHLGLGYVRGRESGTRPERIKRLRDSGWSSGYGRWKSQFVASALVFEIVHYLNSNKKISMMPLPAGTSGKWTTRGVEMVLFMDGY